MDAELFPPIPAETASAARALYGSSHFYLLIGDQANDLFSGLLLGGWLEGGQQSTLKLAMLHLITVFQYMESLPDLLAPEALRQRVDLKYALHLPLRSPGLEAVSLPEFRRRALADPAGGQTLQALLERLSYLAERHGRQFTFQDACYVLNAVCTCSRMAAIWSAISQALEALALNRPDLLRRINLPHWYERYSQRRKKLDLDYLSPQMEALAQTIGADGFYLQQAISESGDASLEDLPEVITLKQVWRAQFDRVEGNVRCKKEACACCIYQTGKKVPDESR